MKYNNENKTRSEYKSIILPAIQYDFIMSAIFCSVLLIIDLSLFIFEKIYIFPIVSLVFTFFLAFDGVYIERHGSKNKQNFYQIMIIILLIVMAILLIACFTEYRMTALFILTKPSLACTLSYFRMVKNGKIDNIKSVLVFKK